LWTISLRGGLRGAALHVGEPRDSVARIAQGSGNTLFAQRRRPLLLMRWRERADRCEPLWIELDDVVACGLERGGHAVVASHWPTRLACAVARIL
jgi:hypothetical protein